MKKIFSILAVTGVLLSTSALAQNENQQLFDRLDRMQRDLNNLQRQVYNGEGGEGVPAPQETDFAPADTDQAYETNRAVNGKLEQIEHNQQKLRDDFEKFKADVDMRLRDLESAKSQSPAPAAAAEEEAPKSMKEPKELASKEGNLEEPKKKGSAAPAEQAKKFDSPQEHYSYAFKQLNAAKFDTAKASLESFIETYPDDALVGNAYYWLGEINYMKRDYTKSADLFREGYEKKPTGTKAADNLFKLGMSLAAQQKTKEACIIYTQAKSKFPKMSDGLKQNIDTERKRLACKQ